jgi:hypothetical protein
MRRERWKTEILTSLFRRDLLLRGFLQVLFGFPQPLLVRPLARNLQTSDAAA